MVLPRPPAFHTAIFVLKNKQNKTNNITKLQNDAMTYTFNLFFIIEGIIFG